MKKRLFNLTIFVVFLGLAISVDWVNGSFNSELGSSPDEAAHYVTAVMVLEFLKNPTFNFMEFAEEFYIRYPKLAIGHWPPVFYISQAVWCYFFGIGIKSALSLLALYTASVSYLIYTFSRKFSGSYISFCMGVLFSFLPIVQRYAGAIMVEIPLVFFSLISVYFWAGFILNEKVKDSFWFGIFASLAILTKGNGWFIGLIPLIFLLLTNQIELIKTPKFWLPAMIVLFFCMPWYLFTIEMARNGMMYESFSFHFLKDSFPYYLGSLLVLAFPIPIGLMIYGICELLKNKIQSADKQILFQVLISYFLAVLFFHFLVPAGLEIRHLILLIPVILIFTAHGISCLIKKIRTYSSAKGFLLPLALLTVSFLPFLSYDAYPNFNQKRWSGYREISIQILDIFPSGIGIIASDPRGDGMFISEMVRLDQKRKHFVLRADKVFADSKWSGKYYQLFYNTTHELETFLSSSPIDYIIVDDSIEEIWERSHIRLLRETIKLHPDKFKLLSTFSIYRGEKFFENSIKLYTMKNMKNNTDASIQINMNHMLGKDLKLQMGKRFFSPKQD